uniref:Putative secreted peptide n=1 Tax=Anopheles braziliensis TaxID=58242 RepID=A0A2M3ZS64_9DIPT
MVAASASAITASIMVLMSRGAATARRARSTTSMTSSTRTSWTTVTVLGRWTIRPSSRPTYESWRRCL